MRWLLSGVGSGGTFLACFFVLGLPVDWSFAMGSLVYLGLALLLSTGRAAGRTAPDSHGWTEQDVVRALKSGREKVARIRALRKGIADPALRAKIERICIVSDKIFAALRADPQAIPKARTFLEQYLDATTLVIQRYADLSSRGSHNPEVRRVLAAFNDLLDTVERTFQKQHDRLLEKDALDLDAEITVLKKMMELEGV
jgi:5-bromo-4-chloroindolyl phosphate hydrolysis protein